MTDMRVRDLTAIDAQAWTATIRATNAGIMTIIKISSIENIGLPIGSSGDLRDNNPCYQRPKAKQTNDRPRGRPPIGYSVSLYHVNTKQASLR